MLKKFKNVTKRRRKFFEDEEKFNKNLEEKIHAEHSIPKSSLIITNNNDMNLLNEIKIQENSDNSNSYSMIENMIRRIVKENSKIIDSTMLIKNNNNDDDDDNNNNKYNGLKSITKMK